MKHYRIEVIVGFFILIGILSFTYLAVNLARMEIIGGNYYTVFAKFDSIAGLKAGSTVEIAGVNVGRVSRVSLDDYSALVKISIESDIKIQEDAIVSIKTSGVMGAKYIDISPGSSDIFIKRGGMIRETESSVNIEDLISSYVFGKV